MRKYENVFILKPDLMEDSLKVFLDKIKEIIKKGGGKLIKIEEWGKKKLVYKINKFSKAYYFCMTFAGEPKLVEELERNLRLQDEVLRYQTVLLEERVNLEFLPGKVSSAIIPDITSGKNVEELEKEKQFLLGEEER